VTLSFEKEEKEEITRGEGGLKAKKCEKKRT
jgi:hypothetical protein